MTDISWLNVPVSVDLTRQAIVGVPRYDARAMPNLGQECSRSGTKAAPTRGPDCRVAVWLTRITPDPAGLARSSCDRGAERLSRLVEPLDVAERGRLANVRQGSLHRADFGWLLAGEFVA